MMNHLWESSLFTAAVAALALVLHKNAARVRHWLWLAASIKFLIPFSLLVSVGSQVQWRTAAPARWSAVVQDIDEQFSAPEVHFASSRSPSIPWAAIGYAVWLGGCAVVLLIWCRRWWSVRRAVRAGLPMRLSNVPIVVRSSPGLMEPGVFGIWRPVLLLPEGIAERLTAEQLDAIVAHELCHLRRRDNLAAAFHMVVEALFWFHPLVWWIGARLVEERERACDEEVLRLGKEPELYAESILKVCRFYLESPMECVAGVTGADLKKRIEEIMAPRGALGLDLGRKALLACVGIAAIAAPIVFGIVTAPAIRGQSAGPEQAFEVASVKQNVSGVQRHIVRPRPGGSLMAENATLMMLIQNAYSVQAYQVIGGPNWINTDGFDIEARPEGEADRQKMWLMLQSLLADRFKLELRRETRELPVYVLSAAKGGIKLEAPKVNGCVVPAEGEPPVPGQVRCGPVIVAMASRGVRFLGNKVKMAELVRMLAGVMGRPVIDRTEETREFDVHLSFTPDGSTQGLPRGATPSDPDSNVADIFAALQEQLGLKLSSARGPVEVLVIDHVEKPSAN